MEQLAANKTKGSSVKVLCQECKRPTKHLVFVSADVSGHEPYDGDPDISISWEQNYQVIQCQGCETLSFRQRHWFSEHEDPYLGTDGHTEQLYPKRDVNTLTARDFQSLPKTIHRIYKESIESCNNDCFVLCAAGLRALVEGICANQSISDGPIEVPASGGGTQIVRKRNLEGKIKGLVERDILTASGAETLRELRFLGNEAVHELSQPGFRELKLAFDIVEHVLEQLYEIPGKAIKLEQYRLRRKARERWPD
jgi:hypothetical protein